MKAWRLVRLGGELALQDVPVPEVRAGSVLVQIHASPLLSYLKQYMVGGTDLPLPLRAWAAKQTKGEGRGQNARGRGRNKRRSYSPDARPSDDAPDPRQPIVARSPRSP
jgi:hypothetical protein